LQQALRFRATAHGADPKVTRGGNLRSVFNIAHWLRDGCNLAAMDNASNNVRVRQGAMVLRGDTTFNSGSLAVLFSPVT